MPIIPRRRSSRLEVSAEVTVGEALPVTIITTTTSSSSSAVGTTGNDVEQSSSSFLFDALDWIGVYPCSTPTASGLSLGRWLYIAERTAEREDDDGGGGGGGGGGTDTQTTVVIPQDKLPGYPGVFEIRFCRRNGYAVESTAPVRFRAGRDSKPRRCLFFLVLLFVCWLMQRALNTKGVCVYRRPSADDDDDPIDDWFVAQTAGLNAYLAANPHVAAMAQAASSLTLDCSMLALLFLGAVRRSTVRPFLALWTFMFFRFIAQLSAVIPCAPGFLWPRGAVLSAWGAPGGLVPVPTLFVDYHPANDMFFSGHAGTLVTNGIQLFSIGYIKLAACHLFALPFVATLVVAFRVHRGMDIVAAVFAAIAACSIAEHCSDPIDRALQVVIHAHPPPPPPVTGKKKKKKN